MKAAGRYRPEARRPPPVPGPCQPTGWAGEGTVSRECTAGDPGATDVPAPGEQVSVCTCGMAVYGVEIVGSIRRRFFSTSSSLKGTCVRGGTICIPHCQPEQGARVLLHGLRMLTISGSSLLTDSAFLRAKRAVMKLLKINRENGITPHPFLPGWLSLAPPPDTP